MRTQPKPTAFARLIYETFVNQDDEDFDLFGKLLIVIVGVSAIVFACTLCLLESGHLTSQSSIFNFLIVFSSLTVIVSFSMLAVRSVIAIIVRYDKNLIEREYHDMISESYYSTGQLTSVNGVLPRTRGAIEQLKQIDKWIVDIVSNNQVMRKERDDVLTLVNKHIACHNAEFAVCVEMLEAQIEHYLQLDDKLNSMEEASLEFAKSLVGTLQFVREINTGKKGVGKSLSKARQEVVVAMLLWLGRIDVDAFEHLNSSNDDAFLGSLTLLVNGLINCEQGDTYSKVSDRWKRAIRNTRNSLSLQRDLEKTA